MIELLCIVYFIEHEHRCRCVCGWLIFGRNKVAMGEYRTQPADVCFSESGLRLDWSVIPSAPSTSQVAGVVAGFVFTAFVVMLGRASQGGRARKYSVRALNSLIHVFLLPISSAILFSLTGGDRLCERGFLEGALAVALFSAGAVELMVCSCWMFAAHELGQQQVLWAKTVTIVVGFVVGATP